MQMQVLPCFLDRSGWRAVGERGGGDTHAGAVMVRGWGERRELRGGGQKNLAVNNAVATHEI